MEHNEIFIKVSGEALEAGFINSENSLLMLLFSSDKRFYASVCYIFTF